MRDAPLAILVWLLAVQGALAAGTEPARESAPTLTLSQRERGGIVVSICPLEQRLFAEAAAGQLHELLAAGGGLGRRRRCRRANTAPLPTAGCRAGRRAAPLGHRRRHAPPAGRGGLPVHALAHSPRRLRSGLHRSAPHVGRRPLQLHQRHGVVQLSGRPVRAGLPRAGDARPRHEPRHAARRARWTSKPPAPNGSAAVPPAQPAGVASDRHGGAADARRPAK